MQENCDKISASVITYNPDIELLKKNIASFIDEVDEVYIIDNKSSNASLLQDISSHPKVKIHYLQENLGIAKALNIGLDFAEKSKSRYFLSMDQDSYFAKNSVEKLKNAFKDKMAIVSPSMHDMTSGFEENQAQTQTQAYVTTVISSGALCRVEALKKVGGFEDKLFIDAVDFDMCYKLLKNNYKILKLNTVFLNHTLGDSKSINFLGKPTLITNHSALRRYYQIRNSFYMVKTHFKSFPTQMLGYVFSNLKTILLILLYEKNKSSKFRFIISGIKDGILGNYGKK